MVGPPLGNSFGCIQVTDWHDSDSVATIAVGKHSYCLRSTSGIGSLWLVMAKEHFFHSATQPLFKKLEQLAQRSGVSRGQAFEDWLIAMTAALAAETMEDEYMSMIERHKKGKKGQRGADLMAEMFGSLIEAMSREESDILGDLFQGAVSYGENSLYVTPASVAALMSQLAMESIDDNEGDRDPPLISDPCCGTGMLLLEAAKRSPDSELCGQDIDPRCVKITSINLGLRGCYGWVVCGNTLSCETQFAYRVGSFFNETPNGLRRGVIRDVAPEETPVPVIARRMRNETTDLFNAEKEDVEPEIKLPTIIEVPQWLARLEPKLAALERDETAVEQEPSEPIQQRADDTSRPPQQQRELF